MSQRQDSAHSRVIWWISGRWNFFRFSFERSRQNMESYCTCQISRDAIGERCTNIHQPHRLYHVVTSTTAFSLRALQRNACQASFQIPQATSNMQSSDSRTLKRASSSFLFRTAVSGMKALRPLKLSHKFQTVFEVCPEPLPINRSTFAPDSSPQRPQRSPNSRKLSRRGQYIPNLPLVVRPEQYRDIPIYTRTNSYLPGPVYHSERDFWRDCPLPYASMSSSDEEYVRDCSTPNSYISHTEYEECLSVVININPFEKITLR